MSDDLGLIKSRCPACQGHQPKTASCPDCRRLAYHGHDLTGARTVTIAYRDVQYIPVYVCTCGRQFTYDESEES